MGKMTSTKVTELHQAVLEKLKSRRVWGKNHIRLETLERCGFKAHERGAVKDVVKDLINMKIYYEIG